MYLTIVTNLKGIRSVHCAIDLGINFFDVAPFYGITWLKRVWAMPSRESGMTSCWPQNVDAMD
jgi:hypothetical protein